MARSFALLPTDKPDAGEYLHTVMNTVLDGLITIDDKGIICSFNQAAERIFGYEPDEVIGKNVSMLMPEPYDSQHDGYLHHYLNTGEKKVIGIGREVSGKRKDGNLFPMDLGINEMWLHGMRMFVGTVRDISKRKEAESQNALLAAIVESSEDPIISKTLDGIILTWNSGAEQLFGFSAADAKGKHINLIIPPERLEEEQLIIGQIRSGKAIEHFETERKSKDGRNIPIALTVSPVRDAQGTIIGASKIIRNISQRKKLESEREKLIEKLSYSNSELERFAYICAHDLQEPLRMIYSFTQMLEKHLEKKLDDKGRHYMKYVTDGAAQARQLISDVLNYARVEHETELLVMVNSESVLSAILRDLSTGIKETAARITHDPLPEVHMQSTHCRQILQNLIGNALKFCQEAPHIHVSAEADGAFWRFCVRDNGIGILPEQQEKIFAIFQRLHSRESYPGTGIGLSLCRKLVQKYGGKIWVESAPGEGSRFYFTLPASAAMESAAA